VNKTRNETNFLSVSGDAILFDSKLTLASQNTMTAMLLNALTST